MATRFTNFDGLGRIKSTWKNIIDTSLHFFNMQDFQRRLWIEPIHPITKKLQECGLVETTAFLVAVQAPELIVECVNHYNLDTKKILLLDQTMLISIDRQAFVNFL